MGWTRLFGSGAADRERSDFPVPESMLESCLLEDCFLQACRQNINPWFGAVI
jgi:hypothetical protein